MLVLIIEENVGVESFENLILGEPAEKVGLIHGNTPAVPRSLKDF